MAPDLLLPTDAWDDIYVSKHLGSHQVEVTEERIGPASALTAPRPA